MWEEYNDENIYICPKCGNVNLFGFHSEECDSCDLPIKKNIKTNYKFGWYFKLTKAQQEQWEQKMRERYVLSSDNPYYDKEAYYAREDEDYKSDLEQENFEKKLEAQKQQSTSSSALICPKCGSKNFTPVPRKWSFLTGFMTNKVDMVCNSCGWVKRG